MSGALERVLVCSPRTAGWNQPERAARWQELGFHHAPDFARAQSQHEALCRELETAGAEVVEMPPAPDLSLDAVYAHDASLPTDYGLIVHASRASRIAWPKARTTLRSARLSTSRRSARSHLPAPPKQETWCGSIANTLLIGHGYRTNAAGIQQMRVLLAPKGIQVLSAPLPYGAGPSACLHLMSLISLLDEHTALVDLPWLAVETVELLKSRGFQFIEIDHSERDTLACNVLALGNKRLLAIEENRNTNARLRHAGFDVRTFPGSELCINGSGGPTCLTRPLLRG